MEPSKRKGAPQEKGNTCTISVATISGAHQDIRDVHSIEATGPTYTKDFPSSNLPNNINVSAISGSNQVIRNVHSIKATGPTYTQGFPPNTSGVGLPQQTIRDTQVKYDPNDSTIYKMERSPRGLCLIINNEEFKKMGTRHGSTKDAQRLENVFKKLHFHVELQQNLTRDQMIEAIEDAKKYPYHKKADAFVLIILSHGGDGGKIYGVDAPDADNGYLIVNRDITVNFNDRHLRDLRDKPKMFFLNTCRGKTIDRGRNVSIDNEFIAEELSQNSMDKTKIEIEFDSDPPGENSASWRDMIIAASSLDGYASARDPNEGSWFGQSLANQLEDTAHNTDLETILKNVSKDVMRQEAVDMYGICIKQTPSIEYRGWVKKLYFNP